ncbi:MAG TPA: SCP2 sterol-binding domain-containing protein [Deltaproteobacteria bacterium]|jgi:putative sterol carrier protein|nr:SCP2 sterol-binding domain-containing protein [Deltaproteobacteria bacterium]HOI08173.1 SCP2 sterol-binding domain-containing protein [Deltaproteobacteria bacterium]
MAKFQVPDDVSVSAFFKEYVPSQFEEMTAGADLSALKGKELTLQYDVDGQKYCLKITDGKSLDVIEGGVDKPLMHLAIDERNWRDAVTGKLQGVIDRFTDPVEIADVARLNTLMATKGALTVDLKTADGKGFPINMVFNGEEKPAVTINLDLNDWIAMQNKETTGQALFMSGKLKFTGDMVFLMKLQSLI